MIYDDDSHLIDDDAAFERHMSFVRKAALKKITAYEYLFIMNLEDFDDNTSEKLAVSISTKISKLEYVSIEEDLKLFKNVLKEMRYYNESI